MSLKNIDDLATDEKLSVDGVPLDLGKGRTLWIRRAGGHNRQFGYVVARNLAAMGGDYEAMSLEAQQSLEQRVFAECIVARWEGFEDEVGPAECTPENVRELFELSPDVYEKVRNVAMDEEAYRLSADTKSV